MGEQLDFEYELRGSPPGKVQMDGAFYRVTDHIAEARSIVAPHNRTRTSRAAAQAIEPKAGTQRATVLRWIRLLEETGMTRDELEYLTGLSGNTIRPRVYELIRDGFVMESGETRPTRSGRAAEVLIARTP